MGYDYRRITTFDPTWKRFRLSKLPQPKIKFDLLFKSDYVHVFQNQEFTILPSKKQSASAVVAVEEASDALFEDTVEALVGAIGSHLVAKDLEDLIDLAWAEVSKVFLAETLMPRHDVVLYLGFDVLIEHWFVYVGCPLKIPAAGVKEGECCCICMEDLGGGGGALGMPCSHSFHGGCIKEWLRKSSSCPLCRYEIPNM